MRSALHRGADPPIVSRSRPLLWPGVLCAVLLAVGPSLIGDAPDPHDSSDQIAIYFTAHRGQVFACVTMLVAAALALLLFSCVVAELLEQHGEGVLAGLTSSAGILVVALTLITTTIYAVLGYDVAGASPQAAMSLFVVTIVVHVPLGAVAACFVTSTTIAGRRAQLMPGWLVSVGLIAGLALASSLLAFRSSGPLSPDVQQQVCWTVLQGWILLTALGTVTPTRTERCAQQAVPTSLVSGTARGIRCLSHGRPRTGHP